MIKFIDYPRMYQLYKGVIDSAIQECLDNGDYIMRHQLKRFEKQIAEYVGTKYAVGVNSGTDALMLSLEAFGVSMGDEVITTPHTFVGTINAITHVGAKPVLVDIEEHTYNIDPNKIEKAITHKTTAIIPVHLNGKVCDMKPIKEIAEKHQLNIVEDACQALGATYNGKKAGSFGVGCFSFYPAKILGGIGDGGIITTNDKDIAYELFLLRDHSMNRLTGEYLGHGYNSRLDNINAAVLSTKLNYLPEYIGHRRAIATAYMLELKNSFDVPLFDYRNDVCQHYVIRTKDRDEFVKYLYKNGVESMVFWRKPLHLHQKLGLHGKFPVTEKISNEVVALPIYPGLTLQEVFKVTEVCKKWKQ